MNNQNIEELYNKLKNIEEQIDAIRIKIDTIYDEKLNYVDKGNQKIKKLLDQERNLWRNKWTVEDKITLTTPAIKSNGVIDLRTNNNYRYSFSIFLHNTSTIIGKIEYRGYHCSDTLGDIGYKIDKIFRGNGYAYQALTLLSEKLNEDGIENFWISTYYDNLASLKTIEKFEGRLISNCHGVLLFECPTKTKIINENQVLKR